MGVLFIAASSSSRNRSKTFENSWRVIHLEEYVPAARREKFRGYFTSGKGVYLWGADERSRHVVSSVKPLEYAVDVCNKKVVQVFRFCWMYQTYDNKLQTYVGWDAEKPGQKRRPYRYIYFLRNPTPTRRREKNYFQRAVKTEQSECPRRRQSVGSHKTKGDLQCLN